MLNTISIKAFWYTINIFYFISNNINNNLTRQKYQNISKKKFLFLIQNNNNKFPTPTQINIDKQLFRSFGSTKVHKI